MRVFQTYYLKLSKNKLLIINAIYIEKTEHPQIFAFSAAQTTLKNQSKTPLNVISNLSNQQTTQMLKGAPW